MEMEDLVIYTIFIGLLASLMLCYASGALPYNLDFMRIFVIGAVCAYLFNQLPLY